MIAQVIGNSLFLKVNRTSGGRQDRTDSFLRTYLEAMWSESVNS